MCVCVSVCVCACVWGGGWCRPESINWSPCLRLGAVCLCVSQLPVPPRPSIPYLCPSPPSPLDPHTYIPTWRIYVYFTSWAFFVFLFGFVLSRSKWIFFYSDGGDRVEFSSFLKIFFFLLPSLLFSPDCMRDTCLPASRPSSTPCPPSPPHPLSRVCLLPLLIFPTPQGPSQDGAAQSQLQLQQQQQQNQDPGTSRRKYSAAPLLFFASSLERKDVYLTRAKPLFLLVL